MTPNILISGLWMDENDNISAYAFHEVKGDIIERAYRVPKEEAFEILEKEGNIAFTFIWNYDQCDWIYGVQVKVLTTAGEKYLQCEPENYLTRNLTHLLNYDWIMYVPAFC